MTATGSHTLEPETNAAIMERQRATIRSRRNWQFATVVSGLILAAAFFLPAVGCRNDPSISCTPYYELRVALREMKDGPDGKWYAYRYDTIGRLRAFALDSVSDLLLYVPPFLFGAFLACAGLARLARWRYVQELLTWSSRWFLAGLCVIALGCTWLQMYDPVRFGPFRFLTRWPHVIPSVVLPVLVLAYLTWVSRLKTSEHWCDAFVGSVLTSIWLGYWMFHPDILFGVAIAFAAAVDLVLCTVGEARALAGQSWLRTVLQLLSGTFRIPPDKGPFCPACSYCLIGLPGLRCPECGLNLVSKPHPRRAESEW